MSKEDIEQLKLSLAEDKKKFEVAFSALGAVITKRKAKADQGVVTDEDIDDVVGLVYDLVGYCHSRIDSMSNRIYNVADEMWSHAEKGHLPPLNAGAMNKMLKVAGLDDSYEAAKKNVYCASASKGAVVEVGF